MTWTHYRVLDHYWDVSQITNLSAKNNKLKVRWKYIYFHHLIDRPVQVNDFQRLPARLLPFFPHNFLPQQRAVNILASRINCLSHPRKTVNRHATSPIFTTNHGRFIKISIWLPSRVKAASGLGRLENYEIRRERERTLGTRKQKLDAFAWARASLGQITEHILPFFLFS